LLIDEPELSLHPEWVMILVAMLREASARCTVVVATQSVELVRWVDPKELVIADATESGVTFKRASEIPDLAKWLKEFSLSELWTMGQLGGRQ
jgi:predicted ATPase